MPDDFDRITPRAMRDDPEAHLPWLIPSLPDGLHDLRLLESQSAPRPGEPLQTGARPLTSRSRQ